MPHARFRFGVPPKTKGDLAFVQHMVAVLNATGRLGVVLPHGVLFRGSAEGKIRQGLLQAQPLAARRFRRALRDADAQRRATRRGRRRVAGVDPRDG